MRLADFTPEEQNIILQCLRASAAGPFFPIWEFHALFGTDHQSFADIAFASMPLDDSCDDVRFAISSALNNLTGYPIRPAAREQWHRFIPVEPEVVETIATKWFRR